MIRDRYVISLVAVGEFYIKEIIPHYEYFKGLGLDVKILTDNPSYFNIDDTILYTKSIFNYFDKIYHSLDLLKQYNKTIIYLDGSASIDFINLTNQITNSKDPFIYLENWPAGNFSNYKDEKCFRFLIEYLNYLNLKLENYPTISEKVMVFNETLDHELIKYELEKIQPVFDYTSLMNDMTYTKPFVVSGAEGLALSIILTNNNIPFSKLDSHENNQMSLG